MTCKSVCAKNSGTGVKRWFHKPKSKIIQSALLLNVKLVYVFRFFGVWLTPTLNLSVHVHFVVNIVSERLYLLNQLECAGLPSDALYALVTSLLTIDRFTFLCWISKCSLRMPIEVCQP